MSARCRQSYKHWYTFCFYGFAYSGYFMQWNHTVCSLLYMTSSTYHSVVLLKCLFVWPHWLFVAAWGIFSCSIWDLVPWPWIKPGSPGLRALSLSHWTTREVLSQCFLIVKYLSPEHPSLCLSIYEHVSKYLTQFTLCFAIGYLNKQLP